MSFTCFDKFGAALELLSEEDRALVSKAIMEYGLLGLEPELPYHLGWAWPLIREPIDQSLEAQANGRKGGRPKKGVVSRNENPPFENSKTPPFETDKGGVIENTKAHTIPNHTKPYQTNPQEGRFKKPSVGEVREYITAKGWEDFAEEFIAHYESNGWKVGRNPMKNWKAACVTWKKRRTPQEVKPHDEYSDL